MKTRDYQSSETILEECCEHCGEPLEDGCDCREGIEEFYNAFYA